MRLVELIGLASDWSDDSATIYVERPWGRDAEAILVSLAPNKVEPIEQNGRRYEYFLEAFIARDFIDGLAGPAGHACERLIEYAENDA